MSVPLPAFRRVRLTQQCVIHPQDKGGNYLPCASEDWVLFVSLAADGEKIILRTEHRCLPIKPGGALLLPPNVCLFSGPVVWRLAALLCGRRAGLCTLILMPLVAESRYYAKRMG